MIYINNIPSLRDPESYKLIFNDRVEKIEIIGGVAVQDLGHVESGDAFSITCVFSVSNFERIKSLWENREKVSFKDTAGVVWEGMRIVMQELERDKNFPEYVTVTFELWRA